MNRNRIYLYGPPGVGKSTAGKILAQNLALPFFDLDEEIERAQGVSIAEIFASQGETVFREMESELLRHAPPGVVALGGGALLDPRNRAWVAKQGRVLLLFASQAALSQRLSDSKAIRPLLRENNNERLSQLMAERTAHYLSFEDQIDTTSLTAEQTAWDAQVRLGRFQVQAMGSYDVRIQRDLWDDLGAKIQALPDVGQVVLVSDTNVSKLYSLKALNCLRGAGFDPFCITLPAGEQTKHIDTLVGLWDQMLEGRLGRDGFILALGGGVVSDLAGFAAATILRGVRWGILPTTLLAMVDASLGGKTGIDLSRGKNLAGAFYPPEFVWIDPGFLATLPRRELRSGLAEVVKHAVIADPYLFDLCRKWVHKRSEESPINLIDKIVRRAAAVKIRIIEQDPHEKGERETLNFGHTIGHAIESASGYSITHGEAVSMGMVLEATMAEAIGLAQAGTTERIRSLLYALELPTTLPQDLDREIFNNTLSMDKKRKKGEIRFSLPVTIGSVRTGIEIGDDWRKYVFHSGPARTQPQPAGPA